jgi:AbrB family looped-hinge helix DNA binding protein
MAAAICSSVKILPHRENSTVPTLQVEELTHINIYSTFCKESKEIFMELAKLTSKGQITIPIEIRKKLRLKEGDKVLFIEKDDKIIFQNASQNALNTFQNEMAEEARKAGFSSEEDVVRYIKKLRTQN